MKISDTLAGSVHGRLSGDGIGTTQGPPQHVADLFEVEGLGQVIVGPFFDGADGRVEIAERGDHDDRRGADAATQILKGRQPIPPGQTHVEHDGVGHGAVGQLERLFGRRGDAHVVALVGE